jgi:putative glutathione S-transferase
MGQLINGLWTSTDQLTNEQGEFERTLSAFHGNLPLKPNSLSRYLLIASGACPWAHRVLLSLSLMQVKDVAIHYTSPLLGEGGWLIPTSLQEEFQKTWLYELYQVSFPNYTGRVTLPLLWDRELGRIVSNDSIELLTFFMYEWKDLIIPHELMKHDPQRVNNHDPIAKESQTWVKWITEHINNGPYKAIFTESQEQYEKHVIQFFEALDYVDKHLQTRKFFLGDYLSICDLCLFPTLYRLDIAYRPHLKCSLKSLADYPSLTQYTQRLIELPEVRLTLNPGDVETHYRDSVPKQNHKELIYDYDKGIRQNLT